MVTNIETVLHPTVIPYGEYVWELNSFDSNGLSLWKSKGRMWTHAAYKLAFIMMCTQFSLRHRGRKINKDQLMTLKTFLRS